ncbi:MAG: biotin--[acetyl-CoA-carboxylase] ligase [Cytophagales bacterium]|nr:biotin--[acetyl-CoA-carboxylase] ligase [Cytophagales bacterium]
MWEKISINTHFFGHDRVYSATCPSTNQLAGQLLAKKKLTEGTLIITAHQTHGKGQRGSTWLSIPYKNLTFSLVLYPTFLEVAESFSLTMSVSLAVQQVLAQYITNGLKIKWPNDLYCQHLKLGGILIENAVQGKRLATSIVGIGLNINQENFDFEGATSLLQMSGQAVALPRLLSQLLETLEKNYLQLKAHGSADLQEAYYKHLYWMGETHTFQDQEGRFKGKITGIDQYGRLVIQRNGSHLKHYELKEVVFVQ